MMELLTRAEAMKYLRVTDHTMRRLTDERKLAYVQYGVGGKMFFKRADLDAFIDGSRVSTITEIARGMKPGATLRKRRAG